MINRIVLLGFIVLISNLGIHAQCLDGTEPFCQCETATVLCVETELDGYTFGMSTFLHPSDGPDPMCSGSQGVGTTSHNPTWIGFIAWCSDLDLQITYTNCTEQGNELFTCSGIQAAVYEDCSLSPDSAIDCDTEGGVLCEGDGERYLSLSGMVQGKTYYLLVDGCCGSACDIEINVIGSCSDGSIPGWSQAIQGDEEVYVSTIKPYSVNSVTNGSIYHWFVNGVEVASGPNMTTYNQFWPSEGEYIICVDVSNVCNAVGSLPSQLCKSVVVKPLPSIEFEFAFNGFSSPVDIANAGDERLFIVEQDGYIRIIENGVTLATPFLDIDNKISSGDERGLLGLAFHPDYANNGYFYVNYYSNEGNTIIARYEVSSFDANVADVNSEAILLTINQPFSNHNAGDLNFSPKDGYLYIAMGDGGSGGDPFCYAQDSMSMLGKMLRIDVDQNVNSAPYYAVPIDNPFVNTPGALNEIYQIGLRNPWRFVFDEENGDLWVSDVGQGAKEEVNYLPLGGIGGENYGWKVMEGTNCYDADPIDSDCPTETPSCADDAYTEPIFDYEHNENGGFSITGGYVLSGCRYPNMIDVYICTDYVSANSWLINTEGIHLPISGAPGSVSTYGVGSNGQVYLATLDGAIYRVNDGNIPRVVYITLNESPISNNYEALDSIIVSDNVTIMENQTITLASPFVRVAESVFVPITSELIIDSEDCN